MRIISKFGYMVKPSLCGLVMGKNKNENSGKERNIDFNGEIDISTENELLKTELTDLQKQLVDMQKQLAAAVAANKSFQQ